MTHFKDTSTTLTITNATTTSNVLAGKNDFDDHYAFTIFSPTVLDVAHVYLIEVTPDNPLDLTITPVWSTLMNASSVALNVPPVNGAQVYTIVPCKGMRIRDSTGAVIADRVFRIIKDWEIG